MVLTTERAEAIAKYLTDDKARAQALLNLPADEAVLKMKGDGCNFTEEEIKEFGVQLQRIAAQYGSEDEELSEDALSEVAGGIVISSAVLGAGVALFTAGVTFGYKVARDRGW